MNQLNGNFGAQEHAFQHSAISLCKCRFFRACPRTEIARNEGAVASASLGHADEEIAILFTQEVERTLTLPTRLIPKTYNYGSVVGLLQE